ncbi:hypothetical protein PG987_014968 [Apiospora arundinis]
MVYCPVDPVEAAKNVQLYFDQDGRYLTEGFVGNGNEGHVYKLKTTNQEAETRRFILKIPFVADDDVAVPARRNFLTEEAALKALKSAMHVVNEFDILGDPLEKPVPGATSIIKGWVYMEWLENGTLDQFANRAKTRPTPLPNRLIWRLLMCIIRMHIALAWPTRYATGDIQLETIEEEHPEFVLYNPDVHSANVMFGHFPSDGPLEHELTPILKMIDLGGVEKRPTPTLSAWDAAIQKLLEFLYQELEPLLLAGRGPDVLLRDEPTLDKDLYRLVDPSMGSGSAAPTSLQLMEQVAMEAIRARTAAWYRENHPQSNLNETDEAVMRIVRELLFEPDDSRDDENDEIEAIIEGIRSLVIQ